jgi:hypothetical protein
VLIGEPLEVGLLEQELATDPVDRNASLGRKTEHGLPGYSEISRRIGPIEEV